MGLLRNFRVFKLSLKTRTSTVNTVEQNKGMGDWFSLGCINVVWLAAKVKAMEQFNVSISVQGLSWMASFDSLGQVESSCWRDHLRRKTCKR